MYQLQTIVDLDYYGDIQTSESFGPMAVLYYRGYFTRWASGRQEPRGVATTKTRQAH